MFFNHTAVSPVENLEVYNWITHWADADEVVPEPQEGRPVFTHELFYDNIKDTDEMRDRIKNCFKKRKAC